MKTVTTKAMAKVAAVATGLAMATSMLSLAPMAHAAGLTQANIDAIVALLTSFGADASTIANVQASLTGGTPSTPSTPSTGGACSFTKDLTIGSTGSEVTALQNALKTGGYMTANATGYFGSLTQTAVIAWQKAAGVTPAAGYFGAKSRAAFNLCSSTGSTGSTGGTGSTGTVVTGNGLKVMLAATSPNGSVLVAGQGIGNLADYVFSNPTSAPINVTALSFKRIGVSNDSTMSNVYLYNSGTRLTDSAGVSSSAFTFSDPTAIFTVPAGSTYTVSVRSDIAGSTSGQQIGVSLVSATSNGTLDSSVTFPINSGYQTISNASLATVSFGTTVTPSGATSISPQTNYPIWQNTVTVSTNPVKVSSMRFTNLGSIDTTYLTNLRLYIDGVAAGSPIASMSSSRTVTFDLSASPVTLSTSGHTIKVLADVTGGASRTVQFSVQRSSDAMIVDSMLNQPVTPQYNSTTFSAVTTGVITINSVSGSSGVSVSLDPASPNQTVSVGASSVEWARFDLLASGENVKVSDLYVVASSSVSGVISGVGGLNNGKIMVNGVQVGSTKDLNAGTSATAVGSATDFSLGSSLILPAGQTTVVSVFADAQDTAGTNLTTGASVTVSLIAGSSNGQGQSSLNAVNVPASVTSGNAISVSSSSLSSSKYSGYGNQTVVAGAQNTKLGSFVLSAGSTEGIDVNTIAVSLTASAAASITNLTLKNDMTGAVIGSVVTTPTGKGTSVTSGDNDNSFAVNLPIAQSSSVVVDVYANVLSNANVGTITATIDTGTNGVGHVTGISTSANASALQTITVGSGSLTVTTGGSDPVSSNVLAGASSVRVGQFNFAAQNSAYTIQSLAVLVPNSAATSVTAVTVSYKDVNNVTQTQTQGLAVNAGGTYTTATATFTGLTMYVPMNDSANLDVSVGTPSIASGATSGAAINITLDAGTTGGTVFRALNSAGASLAVVNSGTDLASGGTFYVRKSIPTFAVLSTNGSAIPSTLYQFSVTADPAGPVEWSEVTLNVSTTSTAYSAMLTGVNITDNATGLTLLDSTVSPTATKAVLNLNANSTNPKYQQVGAGATKIYNVIGTVSGFTTGSTLTLSLASDSTATTSAAVATQIGTNNSTIWSDRSAGAHTVSTTDWVNGYLLKNFSTNSVSYSK